MFKVGDRVKKVRGSYAPLVGVIIARTGNYLLVKLDERHPTLGETSKAPVQYYELLESVSRESTPQELADEYRKTSQRCHELRNQLQKMGYILRYKGAAVAPAGTHPIEEYKFEKTVTTTETL